MKFRNISAVIAAATITFALAGCSAADKNEADKDYTDIIEQLPENSAPPQDEIVVEPQLPEEEPPAEEEPPEAQPPADAKPPVVAEPKVKTVSYITVTADNVNIRSGAGTGYSVSGTAEKATLYANLGETNGWYKTRYKNKTAYISKKYCKVVQMTASENEKIEAVIAEGAKLLGTPYVYGAVRLHDGKGNMHRGFTVSEFDCSSLMQYMFYKGAGKLLQVNTRTQIYQGTTVSKSKLQRGDLIFFTNASRINNKGIERVGHVAMYLGDNYILHTASDYAKIEQISATRWSYYIQTQRMI